MKLNPENPFVLEPFVSRDLFCDREVETQTLKNLLFNGCNVSLISPRRLGKTGLIYRLFDELSSEEAPYDTLFVDISSSQSLDDFVRLLSESVVSGLKTQSKIRQFLKTLVQVHPMISYDAITGQPQVTFLYHEETEKKQTLKSILDFLETRPQKVILAIDEFQQVREYEGVNMEALLRTYIQPLHNVRFIFCGSKKHIMVDMFTNAKKPFYESTSFLFLDKLDIPTYSAFIRQKYAERGKTISDEMIEDIIHWTCGHTYYTQSLCNVLYMISEKNISFEHLRRAKQYILQSNTDRFLEIKRLITPSQWKMLKAVACEESVSHPTSSEFLGKYRISSGAAALRNLKALLDKELLLETTTLESTSYRVYNVFLSRYLQSLR